MRTTEDGVVTAFKNYSRDRIEPMPRQRLRAKTPRLTVAQRAVRARVEARSGGACEIGVEGVCTFRAVHFHHRLRRSHGGRDTVENFLHLCPRCHQHAHDNPAEAMRLGWIIRSGEAS